MAIIITEDEHERAVFRSRRMYQTDLDSNLRTAEDRGIKKVARNLMSIGEPISKIALVTGLTEGEIRELLS